MLIFVTLLLFFAPALAQAETWLLTVEVPYSYAQLGVTGMVQTHSSEKECKDRGENVANTLAWPIRYRIWGKTRSDPGKPAVTCTRLDQPPPILQSRPENEPQMSVEKKSEEAATPQSVHKWKDEKGIWHFEGAPPK